MIMLFSPQTDFAEVTDSVPGKTIIAIGLANALMLRVFLILFTKHYLITWVSKQLIKINFHS